MRVLISGAGVAGPTLAYWLRRYGMEVTVVEAAPRLRTGGYVVDFWGAGFDVAEKMGILPEIQRLGYRVQEVWVVDRAGKKVAGFPVSVFNEVAGGRYVSLLRSDLAATIFAQMGDGVETIFGESVAALEETAEGVRVRLASGVEREFDVVVGADGLHSRVRELVFGPESRFEKYLGYKVAAFSVDGYQPRNELRYMMFTEVGQQLSRFSMRGDRTMFLMILADEDPEMGDVAAQKALLRRRFAGHGWECDRILEAMDGATDFYFDRVSQIRMEAGWSRGRTTLIGDAASCVSLLAGQGSALAMIAAYLLAGELKRADGDYAAAFRRYEERFAPFVRGKQKAALRFAGSFAPRSKTQLWVRNRIFDLMSWQWAAKLAMGRGFVDEIEMPDY